MEGRFVILPLEVLFYPNLSDGAVRLYALLLSFSSRLDLEVGVWPSRQTLATKMGKSLRRVDVYLKELEVAELIRSEHHGHQRTVRYLLASVTAERTSTSPIKEEIEEDDEDDEAPVEETVPSPTATNGTPSEDVGGPVPPHVWPTAPSDGSFHMPRGGYPQRR